MVEIETFSFMTTVPNAATQSINHERSPVLLTTDAERTARLTGSPDDAMSLVKPIDAIISLVIVARLIELLDPNERAAILANPTSSPIGEALSAMEVLGRAIASDTLTFRLHAEIDGRLRGWTRQQIEEGYKRYLINRSANRASRPAL